VSVVNAVRDLCSLLETHGEVGWAEQLRAVERDLAAPGTRAQALSQLRDSFGGMGSLNDIYLETGGAEPDANRRLARLLDACYREATLADQPRIARVLWFMLSAVNLGGVTPRIRRAFR
jgi:hypothetical protein